MEKTIDVGIVKKDENIEYAGRVIIRPFGGVFTCEYHLINVLDSKKEFRGKFLASGLANIVSNLDKNIVNSASEAGQTLPNPNKI